MESFLVLESGDLDFGLSLVSERISSLEALKHESDCLGHDLSQLLGLYGKASAVKVDFPIFRGN